LAHRLRTSDSPSRLILAGLIALALLGLGEAAPGAFPVAVSIEARGTELQVTVEGQAHVLTSTIGGGWTRVDFEQPTPLEREYQVDGSDTTATGDRRPAAIQSLLGTPLYTLDAWLRDESSYSRWEHVSITDLSTGQPTNNLTLDFRLQAALRRPEAPARVWLTRDAANREGLELDRDRRNARWLVSRNGIEDALPRWFFPEQPAPFAAELLQLFGRSAAVACALMLLARTSSAVLPRVRVPHLAIAPALLLAMWLGGAALVTTLAYHQLPHILDSVSYAFQSAQFASGDLALAAPPVSDAFKGPFEVLWQGRIFSQYPPGAPAVYALGYLVGLEWLVGPIACAAMIAATAWAARALFETGTSMLVLLLGLLSPFILFQAGSFFSHPIAGGLLGAALATFVAGERGRGPHWYAATGALLGAAFVAREAASVLFAVPLGIRLLARRRWDGLLLVVVFGLPFALAYLAYDVRQTGSPLLLPRAIFNPSDHFGFGDGVGFHTRHTLAAGLVNTDELLTLLQFDAFGWPPLFLFALMLVPVLLGRWTTWDGLALIGLGTFVAAYIGYFYHGIALGPRYYFEAMPWLLLLVARGLRALGVLARNHALGAAMLAALSLNTLLFYLPSELDRRTDLSGMPGAPKLRLDFVQASLFGPDLRGLPNNSLVVTDDWWLFNTALVALNCPRVPNCGVLFALAATTGDAERLQQAYPGRSLLRAVDRAGQVSVEAY
jgi:hypothetical protein